VAAIHASKDDFAPLGTGLVISERRVLTCAHVTQSADGPALWVAFPKGDDPLAPRLPVAVICVTSAGMADLAVLHLAKPVPAGVVPAPLRCPKPADVVGRRWWAFGFPSGDPLGNAADGAIGAALGYGWLRVDADSRYHIEPGFSGGGLWSPDYDAVVGILGEANDRGDGRAITLHQADLCFPDEKIRALAEWTVEAAGEVALSAWGWALTADPEARRHWRPRSRGVSVDSERGYRFRGRRRALTEIVTWLDREHPDRKVLVVTGSPGVGKSAVLGRIVTTADGGVAAALPPEDDAVRATVGSVACAVHAKGKTALDVATEIAKAASALLPERVEDLLPGVRNALAERSPKRFNVIVDALDESTNPTEARTIIDRIVLPLAETCADVGAQVVLGTRRSDDAGNLLRRFGPGGVELDLDEPGYFSLADLTAYAMATLQLRGSERPGNPYATDAGAEPVAERIAALSQKNFLVAGLIARMHGLHDDQAVDPTEITFTATVEVAMGRYLDRVPTVDGVSAAELLTALAFAEAPGLTAELWEIGTRALHGRSLSADQLARFARGTAANFLVESAVDRAGSTFRLFHQALGDALLTVRGQSVAVADDERALTHAFHDYGAHAGWEAAPGYLFRSLPGHAARAGLVDELLADDQYLRYADLRRLIPAANTATTPAGRRSARLLHLTPRAIAAGPENRVALFSVTEALEGLGSSYRDSGGRSPYRAKWAAVSQRVERAVLEGHTGWVWAVCPVEVDGRTLLASAGGDGTVRIWDPATGELQRTLKGHTGRVYAVEVDRRTLLASAGDDGTVRICDPATGEPRRILAGHTGWIHDMCPVEVDGRTLLASAGGDGTVRIWDPATGEHQRTLAGHTGRVNAVCPVEMGGHTVLASAGEDGSVRIWNLATGEHQRTLAGHTGWIHDVCPLEVDRRTLLASAGGDGTVRIWDPATGEPQRTLAGHTDRVNAVCPIQVDRRALLASAGEDGTVRIWDPATGELQRTLDGHTDWVNAVCPIQVDRRTLLASAGDDGTVRIWDPATGEPQRTLEGRTDWINAVNAVCPVEVDGRTLLASAGNDGTVRIWDPATGEPRRTLHGHTGRIYAVCQVEINGNAVLASAGSDRTVRIWDPATGEHRRTLAGHTGWIHDVCPLEVDGRRLLASGGDDGTVRIWDPGTGMPRRTLEGHAGGIRAVCPIDLEGRTLLASAGHDRTVRIWDPTTGQPCYRIPVHHSATALVSPTRGLLVVGLSGGLLALTVIPREEPGDKID